MGFPRLYGWIQTHRLYRNLRNQATPQLLQQRLREAERFEPPGQKFLHGCFYFWMLLVPCVILRSNTQTELSRRLWRHWKLYVLWWGVGSRILFVLFFIWLESSAFINRGVSNGLLEYATKVILPRAMDRSWSSRV